MLQVKEGKHQSMDSDKAKELLEAQAHIWNHIFNYINSMSLKCAIQLGIPDIIHNHPQPITLSELVVKLSIPETKTVAVYRLMRMLVFSGFFTRQKIKKDQEEEDEGYGLTPSSQLLLKDSDMNVATFALSMLDPILVTPWHFLSTWFHSNDVTPFETANGSTFWDYGCQHPQVGNLFNEGMAKDARLVMSVIIEGNHMEIFEGLRSLVDVGGGTGTVARAIAKEFPQMKCTVFDLPHVVANLQGLENLHYVGGDMFESIPHADAILLKWILHDWSDEECVKILKRCKEAIPLDVEGFKVIIIDMVVKEDIKREEKSIETQLFFDMLMMMLLTGRERNEKEWEKLFLEAGFSRYKITPILGLRSIIEVYP